MTCGIYKITNKLNNHSYIGLSKNIEKRFSDHKSHYLNSKREDNQNKVLYKAFRKYDIDNFNFEIIEECEEDQLKEREIYWINFYNTYKDRNHYNETPGGDIPGSNTVHLGSEHGMAVLTDEEVIYCRKCYKEGKRSRDIFNELNCSERMTYSGFSEMWHGKTWKHIMPEVFQANPHPSKYHESDREIIQALWNEFKNKNPKASFNQFTRTKECYVGYGTAYKMIHDPDFYNNK